MTTAAQPLLSAEFLRKLEQWSLAVRRTTTGQYGGERRSKRHGTSIEFADFRHYIPGDDVRFVDWNLYARLERLFLKLFLHEQELNVHLLMDLSESMTFGEPSKSLLARKLAASIGVLAITHQDGLTITVGAGSEAIAGGSLYLPLCRGRAFIGRMLEFLSGAPDGGKVSLGELVKQGLIRIRRPGLIVLITDFLDEGGFEAPLRSILARNHEVIVLHVLDREEWRPSLRGDLRLIDSEDMAPTEVSLSPDVLARYRRRVEGWSEQIDAFCARRGMTYLRVLNDASPEDIVLKTLRRMGRLQ